MSDYWALTDPAEVIAYIRAALDSGQLIGADTETMGPNGEAGTPALDRWHNRLVGFSVSARWGEAVYVPLAHDEGPNCPVTPELRAVLAELLTCGRTAWHNGHFDAPPFCRLAGIRVAAFRAAHDTQLMAQCLGERSEAGSDASAGLKALGAKYLNIERPSFTDLFPPKTPSAKRRFAGLPVDVSIPYAAADADDVLGLVAALAPLLDHWKVADTYRLEMALFPEILWMEDRGCALDQDYAKRCSDALASFTTAGTEVIYARVAERLGRPPVVKLQRTSKGEKVWKEEPLSLTSNDSLAALLFSEPPWGIGLHPVKLTGKGKPSVDEEVLSRLAVQEDWLEWLLEVRSAGKAKGTYFDTFATYCTDDEPGQLTLHPNYRQFGAETGRTASSDPNVQNLPKEQRIGARKDGTPVIPGVEPVTVNTRDMLVPRGGFYFVDVDWSAIEYRLIAGYSQDPGLLEVFRKGIDIHVATYALMYGVDPATVDGKQRSEGKAQPDDSPVLTPAGWAKMADLAVGSEVIGSDGLPTVVTGLYPQGLRPVAIVTLDDGTTVRCDHDHLWTVRTSNGATKTKTAADLAGSRWALPELAPVTFAPGPALPLDPYLVGVLLGDGCITHHASVSIGQDDTEAMVPLITAALPDGCELVDRGSNTHYIKGPHGRGRWDQNPVTKELRALNLLGRNSHDKFIPDAYRWASVADRIALLAGLLDTDGSVRAGGQSVEYATASPFLADQVAELVRSLGGKVRVAQRSTGPAAGQYRLGISMATTPFRLPRKQAASNRTRSVRRSIVGVELTDAAVPMRCITVAAEDHLYVTEGYALTHNTINYALNFGAGAERLAGMLGCSIEDAKAKMVLYEQGLPLVAAWKAGVEEFAKANKYVETLFGRKRWLNFGGSNVSESAARKAYFAALREAVNCPVQGTAADLLKITLVRLGPWLRQYFPEVRTVLTTHDSITFEVPDAVDHAYFIEAVRPVVEFPWDWQPGWPHIAADFVHGRIGWGSLKGDEDDEPAPAPSPAAAPDNAAAAPVREDIQQLAPPPEAPLARTMRLRVMQDVTMPQLQALAVFLQSRPGPGTLVVDVESIPDPYVMDGVVVTPEDRAALAEATGWVQFHLEDPSALVTGPIASSLT